MSQELTRRAWLARSGALLLAPSALPLVSLPARAADTSGYKALVCVFLHGGNDAYNTLLATDASSWQAYEAARLSGSNPVALAAPGTPAQAGATSLHARLGGVLPIEPLTALPGRSLALHPSLGAVRELFQARRLALVGNVGALTAPLSKAQWLAGTGRWPAHLQSHNDQQGFWQSLGGEGSGPGWGGRFVDAALAGNRQAIFSSISVHGRAAWSTGRQALPYQMAPAGPVAIGAENGRLLGSTAAQQALLAVALGGRGSHVLETDLATVTRRSVEAQRALSAALPALGAGPWSSSGVTSPAADPLLRYTTPDGGAVLANPLAMELQGVARVIAARSALGAARQVFFVGLGGWDTHDDQPVRHARLLAQLGHALAYFDRTLQAMGVDGQVTTFTASDFGRSLASNGDGSDHGWGGHHFVMGGAVRGGEFYGRLPTYARADAQGGFDSPDLLQGGMMLPAVGVASYAATLGRWFGLSDAELLAALPVLSAWTASERQLGFMS